MAGKWGLFSGAVQSVLSFTQRRKGEDWGATGLTGWRTKFATQPLNYFAPLKSVAKRTQRGFLLLVLVGFAIALGIPVWAGDASGRALDLARQGQQYYNAGQFARAAQLWQEAGAIYEQSGDREGVVKSSVNQAQALQSLGLYPKACETLLEAFAVENPTCSAVEVDRLLETLYRQKEPLTLTQVVGLQGLGDVLRRQGILPQAKAVLQLGLVMADGTPEASAILLSLGNVERAIGSQTRDRWDYEEITEIIDRQSLTAALAPYEGSFDRYLQAATEPSSSSLDRVRARLNHFNLLLDIQQWWQVQTNRRIASWSRLSESGLIARGKGFLSELDLKLDAEANRLQAEIESSLGDMPESSAAVYARINFAQSLMQGKRSDRVVSVLDGTLQQARNLGDSRSQSYVLGYLGKYYHQQGELDRGTDLTRQALILAQEQNINGDAREIVYLWQSQLGSLLREKGDTKGAIAAYASAFNTLQSLRTDLNSSGRDVQFDFLREVRPVYLDLVDLLLKTELSQAELDGLVLANVTASEDKPNRLEFARGAIESLQLAELDNFFQDPCSQTADVAVRVDDIDPQAAVIYPIVLKDRLEVILSLPGKPLEKATIAIAEREVNDTLDRLYDALDNPTANNSARNIFVTANPDPQELKANLQELLPIFAQIYDWLIRPFEAALEDSQIEHLVFVSNGQLQRVPMAALYDGRQYAIEKYGIALVSSLQLVDLRRVERQPTRVLAAGVSEQVRIREDIFPALTNVPKELDQIEAAFPQSKRLLNREFTPEALQNQLRGRFPVVHLATHGLFSSNPQKNFIVTGDGNSISIDRLATLLRTDDPSDLELLVLSACETATGDERAVLGLAGVAIRSGARSTLATLWAVDDASTAALMGQFYRELRTGMTKLDALRTAQLSAIASLKTQTIEELKSLPPHPYYWAPYVLVGNWQ